MEKIKKEKKPVNIKAIKSTGIALLMALLIFLISIPINLIAERLNRSWDMTPNKIYALNDTTKKVLSSITKDIDIYVLYPIETIRNDKSNRRAGILLAETLEEYDSYDKIKVIEADPTTDEGAKIVSSLKLPENLLLDQGDIIVKSGDIFKQIKKSNMSGITGIDSVSLGAENSLTSAIQYVENGVVPIIYNLSGHGEKDLKNDMSQFVSILDSYNYQIKDLNLSKEKTIPSDSKVIICAGPTKDISDDEKKSIETFLDNGGNIMFLMTPNEAAVDYTNIEEVMAEYAIEMFYDSITDSGSAQEGLIPISLVAATDSSAIDLTSNTIYYSNANSIEPSMPISRSFQYINTNDYTDDLDLDALIQTADTNTYKSTPCGGVNKDGDIINGSEKQSPLSLAAYSINHTRNESKMVVMGSAEFLDDDTFQTVPVDVFISGMSWMYTSNVDLGIPSKVIQYDSMTFGSEKQANNVLCIFVAVPILIAAIGVFVWIRRRVS